MRFFRPISYIVWLTWQVFLAGYAVLVSTLRGGKDVHPIMVHYPLRVTKDWQIAALAASITATPATLSLGLREPEVAGEPRILLVHAVFGADPVEIFEGIAQIEEALDVSVRGIDHGAPGQGADNALQPHHYEDPAPAPVLSVRKADS